MKKAMIRQAPLALDIGDKRDMRSQFAALCFRMRKNKPEVLLITTRGTGRWIVPKGWPMQGKTPAVAALTEAWEEAGVKGKVYDQCLGVFSYHKDLSPIHEAPCLALVYPVKVDSISRKYPEVGQRRRKWFRLKAAAEKVSEPELSQILRGFDPNALRKPARVQG